MVPVVIMAVSLFPLYWIIVTSLKTEQEIFRIQPTLFSKGLNLDSYLT